MVGLLGVLAAGAAQGYGAAKNQEVDQHNAVAVENMREQIRQEFETRRFNMQRQANREDSAVAAQYEHAKYQRDRSDRLADEETKHSREMEKTGFIEEERNKRNSASNSARLRSAEMRANATRSAYGLLNTGVNAQSTMGKAIQDMVNMGLANSPQEAQTKLERSGILKEMMKNPMYANDPNRLAQALTQWERNMGAQPGQQTTADFIFNPQTGRLEPGR